MATDRIDGTAVTGGWISGFLGMVIFSGSLPATRVAVMAFDPVFLTAARAAIAGLLGLALLLALRQRRPSRSDLPSLAIVALGVVGEERVGLAEAVAAEVRRPRALDVDRQRPVVVDLPRILAEARVG